MECNHKNFITKFAPNDTPIYHTQCKKCGKSVFEIIKELKQVNIIYKEKQNDMIEFIRNNTYFDSKYEIEKYFDINNSKFPEY